MYLHNRKQGRQTHFGVWVFANARVILPGLSHGVKGILCGMMRQRAKGKEQRTKSVFALSSLPLALCFVLSSCTFLYLPPELPIQTIPETFDISGSSGLTYENNQLELSVLLRNVHGEGWLAVQWYAPNGRQAASDSAWIERRDEGLTQTFLLPQRPSKGEWRAVVSFGKSLLRQFSYNVQ
jgi:hypothetical protein